MLKIDLLYYFCVHSYSWCQHKIFYYISQVSKQFKSLVPLLQTLFIIFFYYYQFKLHHFMALFLQLFQAIVCKLSDGQIELNVDLQLYIAPTERKELYVHFRCEFIAQCASFGVIDLYVFKMGRSQLCPLLDQGYDDKYFLDSKLHLHISRLSLYFFSRYLSVFFLSAGTGHYFWYTFLQ